MSIDSNKTHDSVFLGIVRQLCDLVRVALGSPVDFASKWDATVSAFITWMRGLPAAVSPLSRNLEFLRRIENEFHTASLKQNDVISALLLEGTAKPGEEVTIRGQSWLVVNRTISANYGVEYTLTNAKGELIRHEFFD